jgi:sugar transferase (PEP-CTERM/EpsH1 system associated)
MLTSIEDVRPAPVAEGHAAAPLIAHLIDRLGMGGLENGLVNLLNNMPAGRYRHVIVCVRDSVGFEDSDFHARIKAPDVKIISIGKRDGKDLGHYLRLYRTLKALRPDLVHTRNLGSLEGQLIAAMAGVRRRVHGEHGREIGDLSGTRLKYNLLRKVLRPLVGHYIAVSRDLQQWLVERIGARPARVSCIGNGVDSVHFHPRLGPAASVGPAGFMCDGAFVIGSVGRMAAVKDFASLVQAFLLLIAEDKFKEKGVPSRLRLIIAGDGPCRAACLDMLADAGVADLAWLPGARDDVAQLMRAMDVFVLPSLAEGSSNTILEAMASGLPVVATEVGGNPDLVQAGWTGALVPPMAPSLLAAAISPYYRTVGLARRHGARGRRVVLAEHSLTAMTGAYTALYDTMLGLGEYAGTDVPMRSARAPYR